MALLARALLVLLASTPVAALGQSQCQIGQTIVDQLGHCCWPGQGWAPDRQACVGEPLCPTGMRSESGTCVADAQPQPLLVPTRMPVRPPVQAAPPAVQPTPIQVPAPTATVPVHFVSVEEGDVYDVSVDNKYAHTCRTPCHVLLTPGLHRIWVRGAAEFGEKIWVGREAGTVRIERRNGGFLALGIVSVAVGGAAVLGGGFVAMLGQIGGDVSEPGNEGVRNLGLGCAIGGAVLAVVGGVVGFGAKGHDRMTLDAGTATAPKLEGISVMPTPGGVMAGARVSF